MNQEIKQLCFERDAGRCRHCGSPNQLDAIPLVARTGHAKYHLSNLITLCNGCSATADKVRVNGNDNRVGVVLCGGRGTRLYPLTMHQNKHTLPIGIVPMVLYPIKTLQAFGVKRALIVTDRNGSNETAKILGSGKEFGMDFTYKIQEGAGGISEALYLAKDFVREDTDEIVVILGDNIFDNSALDVSIDLTSLNKHGFPKNEACVYIKPVNNPKDYGIAVLDDNGKVTKIVEKPKEFIGNTAVLGLYVYKNSVFDIIDSIDPSERGELEISSVNDYYAARGTLDSKLFTGYWGDAGGSIRRYAECSMYGAKQANVSGEEIDGFRSIVFDDK